MSIRSLRRDFRQRLAEHDWLEGASTVLGALFLVGAVACAWAFSVALASLGDVEPAISDESTILSGSTQGALEATRWFGIVLFGLLTLVAAAVGWFLAGDAVRRAARRIRSRA